VKAHPKDGKAWLDLATTYHSLTGSGMSNAPALFSPFYLPKAIEAYQKSAALLPDHPAPHIGLGLLALVQSRLQGGKISSSAVQTAQEELQKAKALEQDNPDKAREGGYSIYELEDALSLLNYNDATATVDAATLQVYFTTMTAKSTIEHETIEAWKISKGDTYSCWPTAAMECTAQAIRSATIQPSTTRTPLMNLTPTPIHSAGGEPVFVITLGGFVVLGIIVIGILIYLIYLKEIKPKEEKKQPPRGEG
jgi:tetratricopeptide (TPR) repeat protein